MRNRTKHTLGVTHKHTRAERGLLLWCVIKLCLWRVCGKTETDRWGWGRGTEWDMNIRGLGCDRGERGQEDKGWGTWGREGNMSTEGRVSLKQQIFSGVKVAHGWHSLVSNQEGFIHAQSRPLWFHCAPNEISMFLWGMRHMHFGGPTPTNTDGVRSAPKYLTDVHRQSKSGGETWIPNDRTCQWTFNARNVSSNSQKGSI